MSMILHSLFSLSMTKISSLRCSISLSVWIPKSQNILHFSFPVLALVNTRTIRPQIQSPIYCTGASVLFFLICRVSSFIGFQLGQNMN